jgi:hypothetical protein
MVAWGREVTERVVAATGRLLKASSARSSGNDANCANLYF